jgi:phosphate transport system permease protein
VASEGQPSSATRLNPLFASDARFTARKLGDGVATLLVTLSAVIAIVVLLLILLDVVAKGLPALNLSFFVDAPRPPGEPGGGVGPAIVGTLIMVAVGSIIGVVVGIATGVYLSEVGSGGLARAISFVVDLVAGLPSIVIGLFVWGWLVRNVVGNYNGLAGAVALAIIMVPIITRTVEETLRIVPDSLREASLALGIPRWKTILRIVLPTAKAGVITGVVLSLARAGGETAPLLLTALGNQFFNVDVLQPMASLPVQIYNYARSPYADWQAQAWGAALVLIALIGALSALTRWAVGGHRHGG